MMLPGKCPICQHLVTAPGPPADSRFRCPCCEAEFDGENLELIDAPTLIVVDENATEPMLSFAVNEVNEKSEASVEEISESPAPPQVTAMSDDSPVANRARAQTRRQRKVSVEVLKIALGGLAGLFIAQLILWWLPGDLRRDPFKVAPLLPEWLAFITPTELRSTSTLIVQRPQIPEGTEPSDDANDGELDESDDVELPPIEDTPPPQIDPTTANGVGYLDPPTYSGKDLKALLGAVRTQLDDYKLGGDRETRRNQLRMLYQRFCEIGQVATFVDMSDPEIGKLMQATEALLTRIADSEDQLRLVGGAAVTWIGYSSRVTNGVAIAGEVVDVRAAGQLYESTVRLHGRPEHTVRLISRRNPLTDARQKYEPGDEIIAFGSIVNDPGQQLVGYQGIKEPVIWRGLYLVRPRVTPPQS